MNRAMSRPIATGDCRQASRTPRICVVDLRAEDYYQWSSLASADGAEVQHVTTAMDALKVAREAHVDLWVINAHLPGLAGTDLCRMVKSRSSTAAVYLVADQYSPEIERAAWAAHATFFGCKPGHTEGLRNWLAQLRTARPERPDKS